MVLQLIRRRQPACERASLSRHSFRFDRIFRYLLAAEQGHAIAQVAFANFTALAFAQPKVFAHNCSGQFEHHVAARRRLRARHGAGRALVRTDATNGRATNVCCVFATQCSSCSQNTRRLQSKNLLGDAQGACCCSAGAEEGALGSGHMTRASRVGAEGIGVSLRLNGAYGVNQIISSNRKRWLSNDNLSSGE